MSRRRPSNPPAAKPAATLVDLRAAAQALLSGERADPIVMRHEALKRIERIALAQDPVMAAVPEAMRAGSRGVNVRAGVAIVRLQGIITPQGSWLSLLFGGEPGGLQAFRRDLREALASEDVTSVVLDIHSPGGLIGLVPETAAEVRNARGDKPIIAVANTMCASAAYWIAAQADEVVCTLSGMVGSIGVYLVHEDWSAFNEAFGVQPTYIYEGRHKVEGNLDEPLSDEAKAALQAEVRDLYELFINDVAAGRGTTPEAVEAGYGEGRVLPARRAVEAQLADDVATIESVIRDLGTGARVRRDGGAASDANHKMRGDDNPERNEAEVSEDVWARIAELAQQPPPVTL